jgi:DNA-binding beta-propeller fold protein YncE
LTTGAVLSVVPGGNIAGIQVPIHASNVAYPVAVSEQHTGNVIVSAVANPATNGLEATLYLQLKYPLDLGAGSFHDTVQVSACLDAGCVNPVTSTPLVLDVDYLVDDHVTVPGATGYTLRFVVRSNQDGLAWDATGGRLYATALRSPTNLITGIDPLTGAMTSFDAPVMFMGRSMRVTPDGTHVFAPTYGPGGIYRFHLPDWALDETVNYEASQFGGPYDTADLQLVPGSNDSVVVARTYGGATGIPADVVAYDGPVRRPLGVVTPYAANGTDVAFLEWGGDAATIYGSTPAGSGGDGYRFTVGASGMAQPTPSFGTGGGRFAYGFGRLYFASNGLQVIDAATGTVVGSQLLPASTVTGVLVDQALGRVYALGSDAQGQSTLYVLDAQSLAVLGSAAFDPAYRPVGQLLRWGINGLAMFDSGMIYLLSGPLVAP